MGTYETKYPEHEKLRAVQERSQSCGEFLEWLQSEKGIVLAEYVTPTWKELGYSAKPRKPIEQRLVPCTINVTKLLAKFFGIDAAKLDAEKDAMLDVLRGVAR
jgi:hypothetical protein